MGSSETSFSDYKDDNSLWITLSSGDYYPDILPLACELYKPVLVNFKHLLERSHSSKDFFLAISKEKSWMRIQLCRVFRKYVSPNTPVEMLKKKSNAQKICDDFEQEFREITEVQKRFNERPLPDEALCAILWEYKDRGKKGYDLTEKLFSLVREDLPNIFISGPERAGKDILMRELFEDYPKQDRPIDFVLRNKDENGEILAIGLARYDSDRGGAQEDDRTGQYRECALEFLNYAEINNLKTKIIFLNDGPGLLLGSMWDDYSHLENLEKEKIKVVTLRMIKERITQDWLAS